MTAVDLLAQRRPRRADAARNYDALVAAARDAFVEVGTDVPLEEVARRAGVGIATLYRNFPTRTDLVEGVYVQEVQAVCDAVADVEHLPPWDALTAWLDRFVVYVGTKRALVDALNRDSAALVDCRGALYAAAGPLLVRAQEAGEARPDVSIDDVMRLVTGVTGGTFTSDEQRDLVVGIALDGVRARPRP